MSFNQMSEARGVSLVSDGFLEHEMNFFNALTYIAMVFGTTAFLQWTGQGLSLLYMVLVVLDNKMVDKLG